MKKIILSIISMILLVSFSFAQQDNMQVHDLKEKKFGKGNNNKKKMGDKLQLTDAQKKQLKVIQQDYQNKIDLLDKQQSLTIKEYNDRKTALRKELIAKRQSIFTKEQKNRIETAKQLKELRKKEMRIKRFGRMREKLDLSDDQVKQMNALQEKRRADMDKIKNDSKLNDQEKRIQMKEIMKAGKDAGKKILTEEQLNKMQNLKKSSEKRGPKDNKERE